MLKFIMGLLYIRVPTIEYSREGYSKAWIAGYYFRNTFVHRIFRRKHPPDRIDF